MIGVSLFLLYVIFRILMMLFPEVIVKYIIAIGMYGAVGWGIVMLFGGVPIYGASAGAIFGMILAYHSHL
jgi:hypothetical protein